MPVYVCVCVCVCKFRWEQPNFTDPLLAHPDDKAGSKWRRLVAYAKAQASQCCDDSLGWIPYAPVETFFWLDFPSVDQDYPVPGISVLPLYVAACSGMVILEHPEYMGRAWTIVERLVYAATVEPVFTYLTLEKYDATRKMYDNYPLDKATSLIMQDPMSGKLTSEADRPLIEQLKEVARSR